LALALGSKLISLQGLSEIQVSKLDTPEIEVSSL